MTSSGSAGTLLFVVTEDWYFCSHRLALARAARAEGWRVVVATRVDRHADDILGAGLELRPLSMRRRGMSPPGELRTLLELVALYRREHPTVVHHVALKPVLYGSLAAFAAGVPAVVNAVAGLGFVFISRSFGARALRPLVRAGYRLAFAGRGTRVVVQNDDDEAKVRDLGVNPERIALIRGSGVDLDRFAPGPEPDEPVVVTMVSRMLRDKGVFELVEAARRLSRSHPSLRVRLVGPPDPENPASIDTETLEALAREGIIEWCPGTDDVPGVWARSHVAVLPSYREGLPKALLEAAACGRPMVSTDVPGCRDVVRHEHTGLLVPPRDASALASAIARLADDPELRARLGRGAREHVRDFAEAPIVGQTLELYSRLADDDRR
ncbi:MAG: glycosyltransferase family 4 protein [Alphaproteobacteria bacterium]|nr:glycosyltransferase family 4 protein [Alphaproteobacteria bacterium]